MDNEKLLSIFAMSMFAFLEDKEGVVVHDDNGTKFLVHRQGDEVFISEAADGSKSEHLELVTVDNMEELEPFTPAGEDGPTLQ